MRHKHDGTHLRNNLEHCRLRRTNHPAYTTNVLQTPPTSTAPQRRQWRCRCPRPADLSADALDLADLAEGATEVPSLQMTALTSETQGGRTGKPQRRAPPYTDHTADAPDAADLSADAPDLDLTECAADSPSVPPMTGHSRGRNSPRKHWVGMDKL
ncbi:hypothetical protein P7K49_022570 [Saguinus oedipus]|uniref:Uncharacterized protein n=1 Tax=Saguinus oedipus TaxID=9490 RepID=A0ABQ9UVV4_SAGOE|nr:hypothetical protein P7K49_022570 [Saguinus oedipus]